VENAYNLMFNSGGAGANGGSDGEKGTITGKKCPAGLYGTFCEVLKFCSLLVIVNTCLPWCPFFFPCTPEFEKYRIRFSYFSPIFWQSSSNITWAYSTQGKTVIIVWFP